MYNFAMVVGRLGAHPRSKRLPPKDLICTEFSLACEVRWKDQDGHKARGRTDWIPVVAFGNLGNICMKYLVKGQLVLIYGRIEINTWIDPASHKHRSKMRLRATRCIFLGSPPKKKGDLQETHAPPHDEVTGEILDELAAQYNVDPTDPENVEGYDDAF